MTELTAEEMALLRKLQSRLVAEAQAENATLDSAGTSFTEFLDRVGLSWLVERLPKIGAALNDWLKIFDWLHKILGSL